MPTVARWGNIIVEQHYKEHNPPHFHASQGNDEVLLTIADLAVYAGSLNARALSDVIDWGRRHRAELALNWVDAQAHKTLQRIAYP